MDQTKAPTTRDLQARETRRKLLETASNLIVELGYDAVSVGEICRRCSVAKGTFYVHFETKRDILTSILGDLDTQMSDRIEALPDLAPREAVEAYVRIHLGTIESQGKDFTRAILTAILAERVPPRDPAHQRRLGWLAETMDRGQKRGKFRTDLTPSALANQVETFTLGLMASWCQSSEVGFLDPALRCFLPFLDHLDSEVSLKHP